MPQPMLNARAGHRGLGRNHNYQAIYEADAEGQGASGNARVWKVYLDEADAYDSDMVESFRAILDGLLVFASLFSAVVTTFVAQTSQALQPNNAQITALLLKETNQLLRAGGNTTRIDAVAPSILGFNSSTHTSVDVWVNGLFFTSLTLSVTTALLTVLAKQWVQAYIEVVPGDARTQAMVRQFRFDGLIKWSLKAIIEGLPLILHSSVAVFLVGLSLYVSQISRPICAIISVITSLTFAFYLATSMTPAFSIDCPYRLPSMFFMTRFLMTISLPAYYAFCSLIARAIPCLTHWSIPHYQRRSPPHETLKGEESSYSISNSEVWRCLSWLFGHSTNTSIKDVVVEGVSGALDDNLTKDTAYKTGGRTLLLHVLEHSIICQTKLENNSSYDHVVDSKSIWNTAIVSILSKPLDDVPFPQEQRIINTYEIRIGIWKRCVTAFQEKDDTAIKNCLWLIKGLQIQEDIGEYIMACGNRDDVRCALAEDAKHLFLALNDHGETLLHRAATWGNLEATVALLEMNPKLINVLTRKQTALDFALHHDGSIHIHDNDAGHLQVIEYLLDHGASGASDALHSAVTRYNSDVIQLLLDRGWDRTAQNDSGETPIDLARRYSFMKDETMIEFLEKYQTVPLPHPMILSTPTPNSYTAQPPEDAAQPEERDMMSLGQDCRDTSVDEARIIGDDHLQIKVIPRDGGTFLDVEDEIKSGG